MARRKVGLSFKPISRQIKKTRKKLKSIRSRVSVADRKKIDLEIRELESCANKLRAYCKRMDQYFTTI